MVRGGLLLGIFVMGIIGVVVLTARLKVHPFLAIFFTALAMGLASGIQPSRVVELVIEGFSGILGYIAIIIVSATIIGELLDKTGATLVISNTILRLVGRSRSPLAMGLAGYLVSVPVMCCDTGFIILSPLARALSNGSGFSVAVFSLSLAAGAFTSFKLIYPAAPLFPAAIFEPTSPPPSFWGPWLQSPSSPSA